MIGSFDITREPPAACPCGGTGEHATDGEAVRCGCDLLLAAKLLRTHGFTVAPAQISVRILAALRARGRCSTADLATIAYGSSTPENRNRTRSLLVQLSLQNRVHQVKGEVGQWEARDERERKPLRRCEVRRRSLRAKASRSAPAGREVA